MEIRIQKEKTYMKKINKQESLFIDFLKEIHAKTYLGTDDNMPDAFEAWLSSMDTEHIMYFAEEALNIQKVKFLEEIYGK